MQQDLSSKISLSPSFSFYASGNGNIVETAVRVTRESQIYHSVNVNGEDDDKEFEFETSPLHEESFFRFPTKEDGDVAANRFYGGRCIDPSTYSPSHSSPESEDLQESKRYYCFWSPIRSWKTKRRRLKDFLLRRSQSDGAVTTSSESKRCRFKDLLRRNRSVGGTSSISPVVKGRNKTPSYRQEVDKRRKSYLPYRQDLIGGFAVLNRLRDA
ncbi:unnamed protein product [Cochlearia groenlandica]